LGAGCATVTAVTSWCSFCRGSVVHCLRLSCCGCLMALLHFFVGLVALEKMQMCQQMRWLFFA